MGVLYYRIKCIKVTLEKIYNLNDPCLCMCVLKQCNGSYNSYYVNVKTRLIQNWIFTSKTYKGRCERGFFFQINLSSRIKPILYTDFKRLFTPFMYNIYELC